MKTNQKPKGKEEKIETEFPGYPLYPASEDIYSQGIKEENIDPENINKLKEPNEKTGGEWNESDYYHQGTGDDLDVPGSEYDDKDEDMGMEDEENNYYSLGGDNHSDEINTDLVKDDSEEDNQVTED
ncbi:hypothetical protein [Emticicia sp. BO119]|uniref:hypothetical protein n=1 Tax=Emticicia sp. BO119 TaxID=2757768 RepID=UPI0015F0DACA|nr:hypothetical protein [Emticicia sp. BO119]MBA4853355.1 hypothetical protein [Emticicia sp. BO119]